MTAVLVITCPMALSKSQDDLTHGAAAPSVCLQVFGKKRLQQVVHLTSWLIIVGPPLLSHEMIASPP